MQRLLDFLTSTRRPPPGTRRLTAVEVRQALLRLNRPTSPFQVIEGQAEGADLIAEWKIVDAQWYEVFARAGIHRVFRVYLKLVPDKAEVRAQDREYAVDWRAGVPTLSIEASAFRGQKTSVEFGTAYALTETLAPGQVVQYRFSTAEIKKPIQEAIVGCGWTYRGVAFGKP